MKFLIVTGLSGAGKTSVLRHLEDSGYQCMDNIPPLLLAPAFTLCEKVELDTPVALGVDSRSGALFDADAVCSAIDQAATATKSPSSFWRRTPKRSSTAIRRRGATTRSCAAA